MTTKIGKVLTVFLFAASMAFLGFSLIRYSAGANWPGMMQADDLQGYSFTLSAGENPQWTVKHKVSGQQVIQTAVPAQAIIAARKHMADETKAKIEQIKTNLPGIQAKATELRETLDYDTKALEDRLQILESEATALDQQVNTISNQLTLLTRETTDVQQHAADRREDVVRLQSQLEEIRTDRFRLVRLRRVLMDQLIRLNVNNKDLERRNQQLKQLVPQTGPS